MNVRHKTARLGSVALLASALVAASGNAPGVAAPPQDRSCPLADVPNPLPDVAGIVDVEPLRSALAGELSEGSGTTPMLFSARFAADGRREWLETIRGEDADTVRQQRVQRVIVEHMKAQPSGKAPWSVRLQVVPGDPVQLHVSRSEVCPVERLEEGQPAFGRRLTVVYRSDMQELQRVGEWIVIVDVSPTGKVLTTHMRRRSGSRIVDDQAIRTAREGRYRPALVDGIPVAGRYEILSRGRPGGS